MNSHLLPLIFPPPSIYLSPSAYLSSLSFSLSLSLSLSSHTPLPITAGKLHIPGYKHPVTLLSRPQIDSLIRLELNLQSSSPSLRTLHIFVDEIQQPVVFTHIPPSVNYAVCFRSFSFLFFPYFLLALPSFFCV